MKTDRDIILISVFTFITVFAWIVIELFKTTETSTITSFDNKILKPIPKTFDREVFSQLSDKREY